MTRDLWHMKGPARFVEIATDNLLNNGCLIVDLPERLHSGFGQAFKRVLDRRDVCTLRQMNAAAAGDLNPAQAIVRFGLPPGVSIGMNVTRSLATLPQLEDEVVWVDGIDQKHWRHWNIFIHGFIRERSRSRLNSPFMIALSAPSGMSLSGEGVSVQSWRGELRRADTALHVAEAMIGRPPASIDLKILEAIVIEISGWNLELADRLAELDTNTLIDLLPWLNSQAVKAPAHPSESWEGQIFTCSLELARLGDEATLYRRIWRAHLTTIFPRLEEIRLAFVQRHTPKLASRLPSPTPWGDTVDNVEELEFGHIHHLLREYLETEELRILKLCKRMRDQLAHRAPVASEDLNQLVKSDQWSSSG